MNDTLHIFDFDDTLAISDAQVTVYHGDGTTSYLDSGEFALYEPLADDKFDFSEFEIYPPGGRTIPSTFKKLQQTIGEHGASNVVILTARSSAPPVRKFLKDNGLRSNISIVALGSSNPNDKGLYVAKRLEAGDYTHVHVYEDNIKNVYAIKNAAEASGVGFSHTLVSEGVIENDVTDLRNFIRETIMEKKSRCPSAGIIVLKQVGLEYRVLGLRIYEKYDLPKGNIEPGENTFDAAIRETYEEAGLSDIKFPWGYKTFRVSHVTLYVGVTEQDPIIRPNPATGECEHHAAKWLTWDEIEADIKNYLRPALISARCMVEN